MRSHAATFSASFYSARLWSRVETSVLPISATADPDLSVFPSICILVRIAIAGPKLRDIFILTARGPSDGQARKGRRTSELAVCQRV